jgi:transposase
MIPSSTATIVKYVGLDVHAETVAVAIAEPSGEVRSYGTIPAHTHAMDRLHKRLAQGGVEVRYVYEAGPTGFALCRHLRSRGIVCQVVCPSLVPRQPSKRIKTDRRDALALARLYRAGELSFVTIPDEADEAIRDLVRARLAASEDLRRCRQRIKGFLLRYGRRYSGKCSWTAEHLNYLSKQTFAFPAQQIAFEEHLKATEEPFARLARLTSAIEAQIRTWSRLPLVHALMCLRGVALINAVTVVAEIGDFRRFEHPRQFMGFIGIVPSESTSGERRHLGSITKAGNSACRRALVEAAWHYRLPAKVSPTIRARQHGQPKAITDLAWKAQLRLCARFSALVRRQKKSVVAATAIARELAGFVWAIAQVVEGVTLPVRPQVATQLGPRKREYVLKPARPLARCPATPNPSARTQGAPIRTDGVSSLRVATGGDASCGLKRPSPPLTRPSESTARSGASVRRERAGSKRRK